MKHLYGAAIVALALCGVARPAAAVQCQVEGKFSSDTSLNRAVSEVIGQAKNRLTLALYAFDNGDLAEELIRLAKNHVSVRLKVDTERSAGKKISTLIGRLRAGGVQVQTVAADGRNHNKFAVVDGVKVITGSYNWTVKAESNWENILILDCSELAQSYEREWGKIH